LRVGGGEQNPEEKPGPEEIGEFKEESCLKGGKDRFLRDPEEGREGQRIRRTREGTLNQSKGRVLQERRIPLASEGILSWERERSHGERGGGQELGSGTAGERQIGHKLLLSFREGSKRRKKTGLEGRNHVVLHWELSRGEFSGKGGGESGSKIL